MALPLRIAPIVLMVLAALAALAAAQEARRKSDVWEQDHYEDNAIQWAMGRHMRYDGEGKRWEKELALPNPSMTSKS